MFVKDYMTRHPIMVSAQTLASKAQQIMIENNIRHLPVVGDGKRPLGLITRNRLSIPPTDLPSLNVWEISRILSELKVEEVMVKREDLITISQEATLEEAAMVMIENAIGCLPVIEENVVVGIITEVDLLFELSTILGGSVEGIRVTIRVPDKVGEFAKIAKKVASLGCGIYAAGSVPSPKEPDFWDVVIKVRNIEQEKLVDALQEIKGQSIIDVRETHFRRFAS